MRLGELLQVKVELTPMREGLRDAVLFIVVIASSFSVGTVVLGLDGSQTLFRGLSQAGVGLLIAYSVAVAGLETSEDESRAQQEDWLGLFSGIGICGLVAIGVALALAEHRQAGHANLLDELGLAWIVAAIGFLGLVVTLLPFVSYEWRSGKAG